MFGGTNHMIGMIDRGEQSMEMLAATGRVGATNQDQGKVGLVDRLA